MAFLLDPDDNLYKGFDFTDWLQPSETISAATVVSDGDTAISSVSILDQNIVTYWITGGTVGTRQRVTCQITTNLGERRTQSEGVAVVER